MTNNEQRLPAGLLAGTTLARRPSGGNNAGCPAWPAVTCLCPTYGRVERLRDAVACFLLQDYRGEKAVLVVNDAPEPLAVPSAETTDATGLFVANASRRFLTLGHKRQALLESAPGGLVAHWDDDDLYLPGHLTQAVGALLDAPGATCAKARTAWWAVGPADRLDVRGIHANTFEGQMLFMRGRALDLGGYPPLDSGQAAALLRAFDKAGELHTWRPAPEDTSYVYRWADGADHVSARKGRSPRDADFGDGSPLIEGADPRAWAKDRLKLQFAAIINGARDTLGDTEALAAFGRRVLAPWREP